MLIMYLYQTQRYTFTLGIQRVDVLLLEIYLHAMLFE